MPLRARSAVVVAVTLACVALSGCADDGPSARPESAHRGRPVTTGAPSTASTPTPTAPPTGAIKPGSSGSFTFDNAGALGSRSVRVWYDAPADGLADAPVLVVMHGQQRDGDRYRDEWVRYTRPKHALLIVPEFSEADYPGAEGYNLGNVVTEDGDLVPQEKWSYSVIEPLFDFVRRETGSRRDGYSIYGHSAGAQFVHRFMLFVPNNRAVQAVSANAGWYTLPRTDVEFPYGLKGTPSSEADLREALGAHLTVLLGEDDTDTESDSLRSTPEAERQGPNRFARGHYFYDAGRSEAARLGTPFRWELRTVPNAAHDDAQMAPAAAPILLP